MKKVSIYNSDFNHQDDWNDFLEELEFPEEEREMINEVELTVTKAEVPDSTTEEQQW